MYMFDYLTDFLNHMFSCWKVLPMWLEKEVQFVIQTLTQNVDPQMT